MLPPECLADEQEAKRNTCLNPTLRTLQHQQRKMYVRNLSDACARAVTERLGRSREYYYFCSLFYLVQGC